MNQVLRKKKKNKKNIINKYKYKYKKKYFNKCLKIQNKKFKKKKIIFLKKIKT